MVFEPLNGAWKPAASADLGLPKTRSGPAQNKIRTITLSGYLALSAKAEQPLPAVTPMVRSVRMLGRG